MYLVSPSVPPLRRRDGEIIMVKIFASGMRQLTPNNSGTAVTAFVNSIYGPFEVVTLTTGSPIGPTGPEEEVVVSTEVS
jgi:hypothetical protein